MAAHLAPREHGATMGLPGRRREKRNDLPAEWTGCASAARLLLYRVESGGHLLPSLAPIDAPPASKWGLRSGDIDTAEAVWAYFKDYVR
jgi:poly(3-hydroxybutyrate) depolymerase